MGLGKGMFGVGELVLCEVAWYQNTFQEFHDYQIYLFIHVLSHDLFIFFDRKLIQFNSLVVPAVVSL